MEFIVRRTLKINRYIYKIDLPVEGYEYSGEANYCYNIWLRKINVINSINKRICSLKQTNWLLKIVTWIPLFWILPIGLVPNFKYLENETCKGGTKYAFSSPRKIITIGENTYDIYLHSNNLISITKNDVQIALIKKADITIGERNQYSIKLDENLEEDVQLVFLFTIFADVIFYPNRLRYDNVKYEKTVGIDKEHHRTQWKPG